MLIDAGAFFGAVREALRQAQRNVFIIGWDLDSRTRLVGDDGKAHDGWPVTLREFLTRLVRERPQLTVHLLAWDFAVLYALEREPFPSLKLGWNTPSRVRFRLDNSLPLGSSHHQKIIAVDDALAFSGGLDLTIRRWDNSHHKAVNPKRVDPSGHPYRPFHDVQFMVDGEAARALAELARERWQRAGGEYVAVEPAGAPWPESVAPDFTGAQIAIARTLPIYEEEKQVREVEALFYDMIARAKRTIYIENQFFTCAAIAQALARQLQAEPQLEVLMVAPHRHESWLESHVMRSGRIRFRRILKESGAGDRVRLVFPEVREGARVTDVMVHSKVMIVDDTLLRVGSANLNNRSMGTDSECDLALEAKSEAHRAIIRDIRARLIGDHCGVTVQAVNAELIAHGSLIRAAENLSGHGHRLRPIEDGEPDHGDFAEYIEGLADPERPIQSKELVSQFFAERVPRKMPPLLKAGLIVAAFVALTIAWQFPPLSDIASPAHVGPMLRALAQEEWAPVLVIGLYIAGGLIGFPVLLLIAATAATFGPTTGLLYATAGSLASAIVTYAVGAAVGRESLRQLLGPRLKRVQRRIVSGGVLAISTIRLIPIAPFTVVNLVAGASEIKLSAYIAGTVIGMAPGLLLMSALGHQFVRILSEPKPADFAMLFGVIVAWLALVGGVQLLFVKFGRNA